MGSGAARLGIGIAGGIIGSFIAPGIGGSIGFAAGTLLAGLAFPPQGQDSQGRETEPRLQDSQIMGASIGAPLPIVFGTDRIAGEVIWAGPRVEREVVEVTETETGGGGKGGAPSSTHTQTTTRYKYFQSFAVSFGEGPAESLLRVWFDSNVVIDKSGNGIDSINEGIIYRFYKGDGTSMPDPEMVADKGASFTPPHRRLVWAMFKDVPLNDYRIPVPSVTAEIAFTGARSRNVLESVPLGNPQADTISSIGLAFDIRRSRIFAYDAIAPRYIMRYNSTTLAQDLEIETTTAVQQLNPPFVDAPSNVMQAMHDGSVVFNSLSTNSAPIVRIDGDTLRETGRFGIQGASTGMAFDRFELIQQFWSMRFQGLLGLQEFVVCGGVFNSVGIIGPLPSLDYRWDTDSGILGFPIYDVDTYPKFISGCEGRVGTQSGTCFFIMGPGLGVPTSGSVAIYRINVSADIGVAMFTSALIEVPRFSLDKLTELDVADLLPGESLYVSPGTAAHYDATDDTIIFFVSDETEAYSTAIKYDPNANIIVWRRRIDNFVYVGTHSGITRLTSGSIGGIGFGSGFVINTATGDLIDPPANPLFEPETFPSSIGAYDAQTESAIAVTENGTIGRYLLNRAARSPVEIGDIITSICARVGITSAQIDVTDVAGLTVDGFRVARQLSAGQSLNQLLRMYQIDVVESGFKMKFVQRNKPIVATLTEQNFLDNRSGRDPVAVSRMDHKELPQTFNLTYLNYATDYNQDTAFAQRIARPVQSMASRNRMGVSVSAVLDPSIAQQQAEKLLYEAWFNSRSYKFTTNWEFAYLDAGDPVNLVLQNGQTIRARITSTDLGANMQLEIDAVGEDPIQYESNQAVDSNRGFTPSTIRPATAVELFVLDTPLLSDADEQINRTAAPLYWGMSGYQDNAFDRGFLYVSADAERFEEIGFSTSPVRWGRTVSVMPDPNPSFIFSTEENTFVDVAMQVGGSTLESITQDEMLRGINAAAFIKSNGEVEVIGFRDVEVLGNNVYRLSGFLRGIRGTDTMAYGHALSERFVILSNSVRNTYAVELASLNLSRFFKAVGRGENFDTVPTDSFTSLGRSLMPLKPIHETATLSGADIILTWVRRSRVGGGVRDETDDVPLVEASEEYELEIYDGPGGTLLRTAVGISAPTYTYLSADQAEDGFLVMPSTLTIKVFQISAEVGRGFSREVTIEVV